MELTSSNNRKWWQSSPNEFGAELRNLEVRGYVERDSNGRIVPNKEGREFLKQRFEIDDEIIDGMLDALYYNKEYTPNLMGTLMTDRKTPLSEKILTFPDFLGADLKQLVPAMGLFGYTEKKVLDSIYNQDE